MSSLFEAVFALHPFKTLTLNTDMLHPEDIMRDGYRPKMLLFTLDELFYIYSQVKNLQRADKRIIFAFKILCISANQCTDWRHRVEKTCMPNTLALLHMNDAHHLECLVWAVYDCTLLVGPWPKLLGDHQAT